jgi:hypothetical protein
MQELCSAITFSNGMAARTEKWRRGEALGAGASPRREAARSPPVNCPHVLDLPREHFQDRKRNPAEEFRIGIRPLASAAAGPRRRGVR